MRLSLWFRPQESADSACARFGLAATASQVALRNSADALLRWNASTVAAVTSVLGHTAVPGGLIGCCVPGLWCTVRSGTTVCGTQSFGNTVSSYGWLPLDATHEWTPYYTCENSTTINATLVTPSPFPRIAAVTPSTVLGPVEVYYIDGVGLGNVSTDVLGQIGAQPCTSVAVCHTICSFCSVTSPCVTPGHLCLSVNSSTPSVGYCVPQCDSGTACPCHGTCVKVSRGFSAYAFVCVNPNYGNTSVCSPSFPWGPSASTGLDSRVQCNIGRDVHQCATTPPHAVSVTVNGVPAVTPAQFAAAAPNVTFAFNACITDADCAFQSLCTVGKCVSGCCQLHPTGRCDADSDIDPQTTPLLDGGHVVLPDSTAAGIELPVLGPTDTMSSVSYYDDRPMQQVSLSFLFNFYGSVIDKVYLSPNGYMQLNQVPQCNGFFSGDSCDLVSGYQGVLGALIADFDPTISNAAIVWYRNTRNHSLCVQWTDMPLWTGEDSMDPAAIQYTTTVCLYPPGSIRWTFHNFTGPPPSNRQWMVRWQSMDACVPLVSDCGCVCGLAERFPIRVRGALCRGTSSVQRTFQFPG